MEILEPSTVIGVLKSLTTATSLKDSEAGSCQLRLDQLLQNNLEALDRQLETDPTLTSFQACLNKSTDVNISPVTTPRWKFVTYCLKCLHLLQASLRENAKRYKAKGHKPVTPNTAPVISPDTLGHNDLSVVKTALQFVVCLGICPYLHRGVGIPLKLRSGFSAMVTSSQDDDKLTEEEKCERLFVCLKVLVTCIFNPALGTTVLTQHFTDVLASLFQLIHAMKFLTKLKQAKLEAKGENVELDSQVKNDVSYQDMTPASVVDFVRAQVDKAKSVESKENHSRTVDKDSETVDEQRVVSVEGGDSQELEHGVGKTKGVLDSEQEYSDKQEQEQDIGKIGVEVDCEKKTMVDVDVDYCERVLEDLIQKVYPPLLVKTLMMLQGGPRVKPGSNKAPCLPPAPVWLRKVCSQQLTGVVVRPQGVLSVLRGMLDVPGSARGMTGAADWRRCDAVAKVIAHCPQGYSSPEGYYQKVAPQILDILHIQDKQLGQEFLRVACSTISYMVSRESELAQTYIINPMLAPLMVCLEDTKLLEQKEVVCEAKLNTCVEDCHKVFVCGITDNAGLVTNIKPVMLALYRLYVFTKSGVSSLRSAVQELLVTFLKESDLPVSLTCLQLMTFDHSQSELGRQFPRMHPGLTFAHGQSGGVRVVKATEEEADASADANVDCVISLLKALEKYEVSGEFVVYMLNELTAFIQTETTPGDSDACSNRSQSAGAQSTGSQALYDLEHENQSRADSFYRKLMLLNVLATVCEELGPACIRSARQTLHFVKATLERGVRVCKATEDVTIGAFESETLTMAMGLLTAVLTGAFKLTEADRKQMEGLLPLLLEISENHPESSVQEMAADIRVAIATHGAVWSEVSKARGKDFAEMSQKIKKEQAKSEKPKQKGSAIKQPKIEVIHTSDNVVSDRTTQSDINNTNAASASRLKNESNVQQKDVPKHDVAKTCETETAENERLLNNIDSAQELSKDQETVKTSNGKICETNEEVTELGMAFKELCDPLIPVRGHGLIRLTKLVRNRDPSIAEKREAVLRIFEENLDHRDSYLYLSAVAGLAALCDVWPGLVLPRVCEQFSNVGVGDGRKRSVELRMKLGEIMVKATRGLGETVPKYRDILLRAVLVGARDEEPLVRASSLSNLGDICKLLRFSLGGVVHEVFACCSQLLKSDRDVQVRQAAGQALVLLLQGLGQNVFKVLESVLRDLYRLLKKALATEPDDGVKVHVAMALEELDSVMRSQLFAPQKLEKKIRVLSVE